MKTIIENVTLETITSYINLDLYICYIDENNLLGFKSINGNSFFCFDLRFPIQLIVTQDALVFRSKGAAITFYRDNDMIVVFL